MIFAVLWAIVLLLVGGRFLALLVGANQDSQLIQKLYDWSDFWVKPFFNLFGLDNKAVHGAGTFEPASLIAFVVYLAIGAIIYTLLSGVGFARLRHA